MSIIWTNWKMAVWRYRFIAPLGIVLFCVIMLRTVDARSSVDSDMEATSLYDYPWFFAVWVLLPMSGVLHAVLSHERETTAKPLSFCLPGYRQSLRGWILLGALPWGLLLAYLEAPMLWNAAYFRRGVSPQVLDICVRFGSAFIVGSATCMAVRGSRLVLSRLQWGLLALASFPLGIVAVVMWISIDTHVTAFRAVAGVVGVVVFVFFWVRLGNMQYVARGHRSIMQDAMEKRSQTDVKTTVPEWTDNLFLTRAERHRPLGIGRYTWASLYRAFGPILSYWKWTLAASLVLSAVLAAPSDKGVEIGFLCLGLLAAMVELPATSRLLLPGGRRERFGATVITAVVTFLFLVAMAIGMVGLSQIIAVVFGADAGGLGFRLRSIWLAGVLVPWMGTLQLCGHRLLRTENTASAAVVAFLSIMLLRMFLGLSEWPAQARLLLFAAVGLCGWAAFLLVSRHVCTHGDLTSRKQRSGA